MGESQCALVDEHGESTKGTESTGLGLLEEWGSLGRVDDINSKRAGPGASERGR